MRFYSGVLLCSKRLRKCISTCSTCNLKVLMKFIKSWVLDIIWWWTCKMDWLQFQEISSKCLITPFYCNRWYHTMYVWILKRKKYFKILHQNVRWVLCERFQAHEISHWPTICKPYMQCCESLVCIIPRKIGIIKEEVSCAQKKTQWVDPRLKWYNKIT